MTTKKVQFNNIVQNQLPQYVQNEYPLVAEFLKSYYQGQEYQGGPIDLISNIDDYVKIDNLTNLTYSVGLGATVGITSDAIDVDMQNFPTGTLGFPDSYGLLKINDEIITYTGITTFGFTGCVRGFSGITSYRSPTNSEELVFESTDADEHPKGSTIENLSCLFLKEFLKKTKYQLTPGLEGRQLTSDLDQEVFIKQSKDFYLSKGTDRGFEILFKALYNENVNIIRPRDFLFTPSNANYKITKDFVVQPVNGNPLDLELSTLFQDEYKDAGIEKAYAPITHVEKIPVGVGETYYKFSVDAGYNRDSRVEGATYGTFSVSPRTKIIGGVSAGSTIFDVDSTVGFSTQGELHFRYIDNTVGISSYASKNLTQFFGLTGIAKTITSATTVGINSFAYGSSVIDPDETIEVRITSVINSLEYDDASCLYGNGDDIKIKTLGIGDTDYKMKGWFYNVSPTYKVKQIGLIDVSDFTYEVFTDVDHQFKVGDRAVLSRSSGEKTSLPSSTISQITSSRSFILKEQGEIDVTDYLENNPYIIERKLSKANPINFPEASVYSSDVQNVYKQKKTEKILVTSPSIPSYDSSSLGVNAKRIVFNGNFSGDTFNIIADATTPVGVPIFDHGFYTGDAIYYTPQIVNDVYVDPTSGTKLDNFVVKSFLFDEGLYFVERVDENNIKLAKSTPDLYNGNYVNIDNIGKSSGIATDNRIEPFSFNGETLQSQKLVRSINPPVNTGTVYETTPGSTGILVNGVEILNYKSYDKVYYGKLESIDVLAPGSGYDVINPPITKITDSVGTGATGFVAVSGSLKEIRIIDPGFGYQSKPTISITGGNGEGADVSINMQEVVHSIPFFSSSSKVGLGTTGTLSSTIGFSTYHKFANGEQVLYITDNQDSIGGLTTNATYFASVVGSGGTTIRLHTDEAGALAGINTVELTSRGDGVQHIRSYKTKSLIESINVISGGSGYENKKRTVQPAGITTSLNQIKIVNHDYKDGEIVNYTCTGTPITGLTTATDYYVCFVDKDNFKLASVGVGTTTKDFYYRTKQHLDFTYIGVGTHQFNYPPISVTLNGEVGVTSVGKETFEAKIQPIFRGEVTSIHLADNGVGYGSSEIINFNREPDVTLSSGVDGQVQPIVHGGKITEVIVENKGQDYIAPPILSINGDGVGCVITPVLKTVGIGTSAKYLLEEVKVIKAGSGYTKEDTTIDVISPGSDVKLRSNIQQWTVNLFEKYYQGEQVTSDDGILVNGLNKDFGLQYTHLYAPRKLRESLYATNQEGTSLYGQPDLKRVNGQEIESTDHSPIIGWAYDGNPIYGPYGYVKKEGGSVTQMKSGYVEEAASKLNRPPLTVFGPGFFVEDYTFKEVTDETVLDENNGRFCITPQFPNGVYAYFATINDSGAEQGGQFNSYKLPVFPYLLGDNYQSTPEEFNFTQYSNQDDYIITEDLDWYRNTAPYNLIEGDITYPYISIPDNLSQTLDIKGTKPGHIESIGITTGGKNYKVGDKIIFNNEGTSGSKAAANVSKIVGKSVSSVSVATSTVTNVEFYPGPQQGQYTVLSSEPYNWTNNDIVNVTGLSTTSSNIEGTYNVGITSNKLFLAGVGTTAVAIGTDGVTGVVTHLSVWGDLTFPIIRSNDILGIGTEQVKVLNVEAHLSRIRVLRAVNGVTGVSHTITTELLEDPRKLTVNPGVTTDYEYRQNHQIYFEPKESVGVGTLSAVGMGSTLVFSNPGVGLTELFVYPKEMYLPNHDLKTGDKLTYSPGNGAAITIWEDGKAGTGIKTLVDGQTLFAAVKDANIIGLSTCRVGLGTTGTFVGIASTQRDSTTFFFAGIGTGVYHSLKTNYEVITGEINRVRVTVSTGETHGLLNNDHVYMNVSPGISTNIIVKYNDYNRKIVIDPKSFTSAGINTTTNAITITNHGYSTGDKIIHTVGVASAIPGGLVDNGTYYIVKVDDDTIKLSNTQYDSTEKIPSIVGITSAGDGGIINPINPPIKLYRDCTAVFDVSDSSLSYVNQSTDYSAFKLTFYRDQNFTKIWDTSTLTKDFNVVRNGAPGITTNANVTLTVTKDIPNELYYKLDPIYDSNLPDVKKEVTVDKEVVSANQVTMVDSLYNGKQKVSIAATNQFRYTLPVLPEKDSYGSLSDLSYETDSVSASGAISNFEIKNPGNNYYALPGINTINSVDGSDAIVEGISTSIGKIRTVKLREIGYNFPSDPTLMPSASLPQVIQLDALKSVESVGVTSFGKGYISSPHLIVIDGFTNKPVFDLDLKYELGNPNVEILKNTSGIHDTPPDVIPTKNSNGVGIATVGFNTVSKNVTVTLATGFSTANSFPFEVGDKVFIEGISVGLGTTARGYNSSEYDYKLFDLTEVDENLGGIGSVTYNLTDFFGDLAPELTPGTYDFVNSAGRIVAQKTFPRFTVNLTKSNDYVPGETVTGSISSTTGEVQYWEPNTGILRVSAQKDFVINDIIVGSASGTQGTATSIKSFDAYLKLDATARVEGGWETESGFFNRTLQRFQDSDYYQNLSYSLSSRVDMQVWDDPVSTLNHTLGFKKFSDYQLESTPDQKDSLVVGLSTELTGYTVVNDLQSAVNMHTVFDFDLASENNLTIGSDTVSNEITFSSRILQDFQESIGNRAVSIDDFSGTFNSNPRSTRFTTVASWTLAERRALKYFLYVKDKRFTAQRQLTICDIIHDNNFGYINQYGKIDTVYNQGDFDFAISGSLGELRWYPVKYSVNDYWIASLSFNLDDNALSTGSTVVGPSIVDTESVAIGVGIGTTTIVGIASTYRSAHVIVSINPDINYEEFEYNQFNIIHNGTDVEVMEYGRLSTNITEGYVSRTGMGTYHGYIEDDLLKLDFYPNSGVGIGTTGAINTMLVGMASSEYSGISTVELKHSILESRCTGIGSTTSPIENVIAEYPPDYQAAYCYVQITDCTNKAYQMSEFLCVNDFVEDEAQESYDVQFGDVYSGNAGLGTIGSRVSAAGTMSIVFTPNPSMDVQTNVWSNVLKIEDDLKDTIDFDNGAIESGFGDYEGTDRAVKRQFELKHRTDTIFEKSFVGEDSRIVDVTNNVIILPNHFFVTGEKLLYNHAGAGKTMAVGIATTNGFVGVGTTNKLPGTFYAVKIDDDSIKIAETAEKALKTVPEVVDITSVGIGTSHRFNAVNQNAKLMVSIDNVIQSPIVATAVTSHLTSQVLTTDEFINLAGITSIFGGDLVKVGDEIMRVDGVGIGLTNRIQVRRPWMGTALAGYSTATVVTKVVGNYNIVDNTINFVAAPSGNVPLSTTTNRPDERDWVGISTGSSFDGRMFMRSGVPDTTNETYYRNYVFDSLSDQFTGQKANFTLKSSASNVSGLTTDNAIILVNDVFQTPGPLNNYTLDQTTTGITTISFTGTGSSVSADPNVGTLPLGGAIVSVASTEGFGYQPLVAAGGTAVVSTAGTIESVSIANTGSGYRIGVQTVCNVAIQTSTLPGTSVIGIGTAIIAERGFISGIAITNPYVFNIPVFVSNVGYDTVTGLTTVTTSSAHGFSLGEEAVLSGIAFTCNYSGTKALSNFVYTKATGIATVTTSAAHGYSANDDVILTGLAVTEGSTNITYPRTSDPYYTGSRISSVPNATSFVIQVGTSSTAMEYTSGGTVQKVIVAPRKSNSTDTDGDPAYNGTPVLQVIDTTKFVVNTGINTNPHLYNRGGVVRRPLKVIIDDPLPYAGIALTYSNSSPAGVGTGGIVDVVVGQGSSVISFTITNTGSGYGNDEILTLPIGGPTGIPTDPSKTYKEFQLTLDPCFYDEFTGWSIGELQSLDNIEKLITGTRKDFPLELNGETITIRGREGSKIVEEDLLLVFVNDVPQVPGGGYTFPGGSNLTFTEAPKVGDKIQILFYKGTGSQDVVERRVLETVKPGDELEIGHLESQDFWLTESIRVPLSVDSTDRVSTPPYYGPGNTADPNLERPIKWTRQTEDKVINQIGVGKDREIYEPVINPYSPIIKSVGIGSTVIYVENARPYFDPYDEVDDVSPIANDFLFQKKVKFISQEVRSGAAGTAIVSGLGTITSVAISTGGIGYSTAVVSFGSTSIGDNTTGVVTTSTRAYGTPIISAAGTITGIAITAVGSGYTSSNPPSVLISPPVWSEEENTVTSYGGDSGIIVGFGTTTVGVATGYQLVFDLHIPASSDLRNSNITGTAVTISGISTGDYFIVNDSNVGASSTSIASLAADGAVIGIGTQFVNNVYEVNTFEIVQSPIGVASDGVGIGTTHMSRVFVKIAEHLDWNGQWPSFSGVGIQTGNYFGSYSWGKILLPSRSEENTYEAYTLGGTGGISTSPVVRRSRSLKSKQYYTPPS